MEKYNLSSSMTDRINFDEMAFRAASDKLENWPASLAEFDVDELALDEFDLQFFDVDDMEEAKARWIDQWRRLFNAMK